MSSSDTTAAQGEAVAAEPAAAQIPAAENDPPDDREEPPTDSWFTPGPKRAAEHAAGDESPEWFLPGGRAGLLPDSVTDSVPNTTAPRAGRSDQGEAAGSPPWEGEPAQHTAGGTPPWENGPWPGPGDPRPANDPRSAYEPGPPFVDVELAATRTEAAGRRRLPGHLLLAAGAGLVVVIAVIVVIVVGTSGGQGCGTYPAAVRHAYLRAMADLRGHAPAAVQAAALAQAETLANTSAASAGQLAVRNAMFAMASDLDQAHADVMANRALSSTLLQHLTADGTALPASCPS